MYFSICIAVYNAEKYLADSIQSILSQSEQDFEILLIDDCSKDNSGKLCDEFAAQYPDKIRTIHHSENQGLLLARRTFFNAAKGEWFVAVDADDLLAEGALAEIRGAIEETGCDLLLYDLTCEHRDGKKEFFTVDLKDHYVYSGEEKKEVYNQIYFSNYINSMCTKAIHRTLIDWGVDYTPWKGLRFGTDIFQSYPILDAAERIVYLKKSLYSYIKREEAITTKWHKEWYSIKKMLWDRDSEYRAKWRLDSEIEQRALTAHVKGLIPYLDRQYEETPSYPAMREWFERMYEGGDMAECYRQVDRKRLKKRYRLYTSLLIHRRYRTLYGTIAAVNRIRNRKK